MSDVFPARVALRITASLREAWEQTDPALHLHTLCSISDLDEAVKAISMGVFSQVPNITTFGLDLAPKPIKLVNFRKLIRLK